MATYLLSVSESPSTKHGWNESDIVKFVIKKHVHEHGNLPTECVRVTINKTWLKWVTLSSLASTNGKCVHEHGNLPPERIQVTINKVEWEWHCQVWHQQTVNVCMSMATYLLCVSESPSTKHGRNERDIVKFAVCVHGYGNLLPKCIQVTINKTWLEWEWHCQVRHQKTCAWAWQLTNWVCPSHHQQNMVEMSDIVKFGINKRLICAWAWQLTI